VGRKRRWPLAVSLSALLAFAWSAPLCAQDLLQSGSTGAAAAAWNSQQAASAANPPPGVIPQPTLSAPGTVTGVSLGELYTDNLTLAGPGQSEQSSFITQIEPFIKSAYSGPRFSGILDYSLTGYLYRGQSQHNQLAQNLSGQGTLTLVPQHFFLDGIARYARQIINNQMPSGSGSYFLDNNQANTAMVLLSPYWVQQLSGLGTLTLRYSHGRVVYNDRGIPAQNNALLNGIPNVTSNGLSANLVSPAYGLWTWNLGYANQRLEPDYGSGMEFAAAKFGNALQITANTRLLADIGKESRFLPDGSVQYLGARFWDAGFEWANGLDDFRLLTGHRFYGRSYALSWTHNAALLATNLSYSEQPTDYNQQLLGQNPTQSLLSPSDIPRIPSLSERRPYLSKRASASVIYNGASSTLTLTLYEELRTYFVANSVQERVADAQLSWLFELGALTTLTPEYGWQRYRFQGGQISYNHFVQLSLAHQFGRDDSLTLKLRNDSSNVYYGVPGAHGYRVNVIFLMWTHLF